MCIPDYTLISDKTLKCNTEVGMERNRPLYWWAYVHTPVNADSGALNVIA